MAALDRTSALRSLEQREVALVRALMRAPGLLDARGEVGLRTAIGLARLHHLPSEGGELDVEELVLPLRSEVLKLLEVAGLRERDASAPSAEKLRPVATILREQAIRCQAALRQRLEGRVPGDALDREVRERRLALALGGGGGSGYIYLGAFKLLEECGLRPALIAGTSMGSVLGLFRAKSLRFDTGTVIGVVRSLAWGKLFQLLSMESRYGLPAAMRLYLRAAIGRFFLREDGQALTLKDLAIPLVVPVSGIRAGVLPHSLEFYEHMMEDLPGVATPFRLARRLTRILGAIVELAQLSERLDRIYLGLEEGTETFDALDAVGFSSALPGVIHYDLVRKDDRMHAILQALFSKRDLFRLADGGLVDNVPATAAWQAVQKGTLGTRSAFVLALDGFSPKLRTPAWLPLQGLASAQVQQSCQFAHLYKAFKGTLSPLELVPSVASTVKMIERGREELSPEVPFIRRMLQPLPAMAEGD